MRNTVIFIFIFLSANFFAGAVYAQNKTVDSLKKVLLAERADTVKINVLNALSAEYLSSNSKDSALSTGQQAIALAKKIGNENKEADALIQLSTYYNRISNYDTAVAIIREALELYKKSDAREKIAFAYASLGAVHTNANRGIAIQDYYAALRLYDELGNKKQKINCLCWIGFNYYWQKNYPESFNAFKDALAMLDQEKQSTGFESSLCHIYLANIYRLRGQLDKALVYDSIGLQIANSMAATQIAANGYSTLGDIFSARADFPGPKNDRQKLLSEAVSNYKEALFKFRDVLDTGGMGDSYSHLAETYTRLHEFSKAQQAVDSAFHCARIMQFKDNFSDAWLAQSRLDSASGNFDQGWKAYKKYVAYQDTIHNEETTKRMFEAQMQYGFDKKQAVTKAETEKIKNRNYFVIGALALIVLAVLVIVMIQYRNNQHKQQANKILGQTLADLRSTQSQLIQSEKMASLGELTAGIAHEIQNPLNFVNNFSEVNRELIDETSEAVKTGDRDEAMALLSTLKENEEKITHHGKRADAIVKGMLQHSRSNAAAKELADINGLANEYLQLAYHGFKAKDKDFTITMQTDFDHSIGKINIVPQDIGRVLLNLYNNAFYAVAEKQKFVPADKYEPILLVSTKKTGTKILITVRDNGNGIPQKVADKIFQPFFTTKPTGQGTGLGLSLSYDIVKAHGGEIKVNTMEQEFTEFVVQLPA